YVYLFIFKIFGRNISDIRLFSFIYALAGIMLLYKLGELLFNKPVGLIASFIFGVISADPARYGFMAKAENFMLAPLIGSMLIFYLALTKKDNRLFFASGLLTGLAFILKQSAVFSGLFIIVFLFIDFFIDRKEENFSGLIKRCLYFITGFVTILLPVVIYFRLNGAWDDFVYWTFWRNIEYVDTGDNFSKFTNKFIWFNFLKQFNNLLKSSFIFWIPCVYGIWYLIKQKNKNGILITGWFIFSLLSVFAGLRFSPHYFLLTTPVLAITASYGLWLFFEKIAKIEYIIFKKILVLLIACLFAVFALGPNFNYYFIYSPRQISKLSYGDYYPLQARIKYIAAYINQNTYHTDTVLIFDSAPDLLFYAKRKSATKYIIFYPLAENSKDSLKIQKDIIREITLNKPKYIIDMTFNKRIFAEQYIVKATGKILHKYYYPESFVSLTSNQEAECVVKINRNQLNYAFLWDKIVLYRLKE
ncbi:MAG: glycosyltransferase family 39 protein, partial [bacterium]